MNTAVHPNDTLKFLQSIAPTPEQVLSAVGLEGALPVNPADVANRLGVNCIEVPAADLAMAIGRASLEGVSHYRAEDDTYWIVYGSEWHEHATRFTIAHELGHVILHKNYLPLARNRAVNQQLETAANRFAAGLLMPQSLIRRYISLPASEVARVFRVSPRAAEIRLSNVG